MAEIVNLRRTRKRKARDRDRTAADANAARHGETKLARSLRAAQTALDTRRIESHRREEADDRE